jgi:phosphorylase superfamily protein
MGEMAACKYLILSALTLEAEAIGKVLTKKDPVTLEVIGPRGVGLTDKMLAGMSGVILAGLGGALDPKLKVGDVVCYSAEPGRWPELPYPWDKIFTSEGIVDTPEKKAEIFKRTGAAVVDMETGIVEAMTREAGVPLLVIRAISDTASDVIPAKLINWVDSRGRPKKAKAAWDMARDPGLVPQITRLSKNSGIAGKSLARAVRLLLDRSHRGDGCVK